MSVVRVFINETEPTVAAEVMTSHWFGYNDTHSLRLAIEYEERGDDAWILEDAFRAFNEDPSLESDDKTLRYRLQGNRSLSVGDVVEIDGRRYACEWIGWKRIET